MADPKRLPKPRNPFALHAMSRTGGGFHKSRPRYTPTVEEYLDEMEDEKEELRSMIDFIVNPDETDEMSN